MSNDNNKSSCQQEIPSWMLEDRQYEPQKDHDGFITKSILQMMGVLSKAREDGSVQDHGAGAAAKLFFVILTIILMACSHNMFFSYCMLAMIMVLCCTLPGKSLKRVITGAVSAFIFSAAIMVPAVFLGSPRTMLTVSAKVFISVALVNWLASSTKWNRITSAFRFYHVPDLFIFTFDITLKYIVLLGDICMDMLQALRLRSVGHNAHKSRAFSGILGVTFLKSRQMSEEMYDAMRCRGFEGEYRRNKKNQFGKKDFFILIGTVAMLTLFIYLERIG